MTKANVSTNNHEPKTSNHEKSQYRVKTIEKVIINNFHQILILKKLSK